MAGARAAHSAVVTVAAEHGAGGDLVAPRVAEALGVRFLDRALPASLLATADGAERPNGLVASLARASTVFAGEPVERMDLDEGQRRAELAEFLARSKTAGGVLLGRGGVVVLADEPKALHVLLAGDLDGRVEREGVSREEARVRGIVGRMSEGCSHLEHVLVTQLPETVDGCAECLETGSQWCHLRICLECGHVGCCDSSPSKHATAHARETGHPLIRSVQPGEDWSWCYLDQVALVIDGVGGETRIPPSPLC